MLTKSSRLTLIKSRAAALGMNAAIAFVCFASRAEVEQTVTENVAMDNSSTLDEGDYSPSCSEMKFDKGRAQADTVRESDFLLSATERQELKRATLYLNKGTV